MPPVRVRPPPGPRMSYCKNMALYIRDCVYLCLSEGTLKAVGPFSGSSAVEYRTRNQVSPGSNPPLVPFRRLGILVLSIDATVDSAV